MQSIYKTEEEIKLLRYVNNISSEAHKTVMRRIKAGMMEYQCEAIFLYECYYNGGCRYYSYVSICASGHNGATLHYGNVGAPNDKKINDGEMVVFDMGAEYHCYTSDITCSFPVNGKFTQDQRDVYESVLTAQQTVLKTMKPGVLWPDMHRLAGRVILEQLKKRGFLLGEVEEMYKNHIQNLFMPHGLGHLMGLDVHDVGGYIKGVERSTDPGLKGLRCGRKLEPGMVITVEPGIYFIEAILEPAFKNPEQAKFLNIEKLKKIQKFWRSSN